MPFDLRFCWCFPFLHYPIREAPRNQREPSRTVGSILADEPPTQFQLVKIGNPYLQIGDDQIGGSQTNPGGKKTRDTIQGKVIFRHGIPRYWDLSRWLDGTIHTLEISMPFHQEDPDIKVISDGFRFPFGTFPWCVSMYEISIYQVIPVIMTLMIIPGGAPKRYKLV